MKTCLSRARLAALPLALCAAFPVLAQTQPEASLQETVVTATRVAQPLADLVADVTIIDHAAIARSGASVVADVLARVPGIEIARNGGPGTVTSVYLRGSESRFTAVYIDGVRIDSQATGGALWEQIPLAQIDHIEVLRGPAAAVYGSDAIGGVIQLFTRKGEGKAAPYVGIGYGTYNTRKVEAGVSGAAGEGGAFDYSLGIAHEESDGFDSRTGVSHNPDLDGFRSTSAHARLGFQINRTQRLDATLLANDLNSGYDALSYDPLQPADDRNLERLRTAGLTWSSQWTEAYSTKLSVTGSTSRYESTPSPYLAETQLHGYLFQNEYRVGPHLFTAALERREDHLFNPALDPFSTTIDGNRTQNGLALGYGYHAGPQTLQLNVRRDNDSAFGGRTSGSAAYGYAITPQWRATASTATAFRAPTLYQLFSQYGVPNLEPEISHNLELGLHYRQGAGNFNVVAYRNRVSNLISFAAHGPCAFVFGCYANTAQAEYSGVTISGGQQFGLLNVHASLDVQDPRDLGTGHLLARRARRHGTLGADTQVAGWTVGAEAQFSSRRYDDAANLQPLGGYALLGLYASTHLSKDWTLLARVDNLADKNYQLAYTYTTPGRTFYAGLKWAPQ